MGLICAALHAPDTASARELLLAARAAGADLAELRLDLMREFDLEALLAHRPLPVIVTFRRADQGGGREIDETERLGLLNRAAELGADYVDVELGSEGGLRRGGSTRVIVSFHDFDGVPADLEALARKIETTAADIVKIAVTPASPLECLPLYDLPRRLKKPFIGIGMGEPGAASRLLGLRFGMFLSYGALSGAAGTAPGQLPVEEMLGACRAKSISLATRLFGVIGDPIGHSLSPAIHNAAYRALGLDALYVSFRVPVSSDAGEFLRCYARLGFAGFSVTLPHKLAALAAADEADAVARKIGAANTITVRGGRLLAANTDAEAAVAELARAFGAKGSDLSGGLAGRTVLLLGAGGAARAVAWGLVELGRARVVVANRSRERGMKLAAELGAEFVPPDALAGLAYDAVVNTTPLGMSPLVADTPLPAGLIRPGAVVFDTIYNPLETRLLREAKERGARTVDGLGMFVEQGARQVETWTARSAPREVMRRAALEKLGLEKAEG